MKAFVEFRKSRLAPEVRFIRAWGFNPRRKNETNEVALKVRFMRGVYSRLLSASPAYDTRFQRFPISTSFLGLKPQALMEHAFGVERMADIATTRAFTPERISARNLTAPKAALRRSL